MSAHYQIRRVTLDDAEATLNFLKSLADEPNNNIPYSSSADVTSTVEQEKRMIEHFGESPNALWLLAIDEQGGLIGSLAVRPYRGVHCYTVMATLIVAKAWRDQGVGTSLSKQAIDWCAANPQIKRLEFDVFAGNARALHVYEKLGFHYEGKKEAAVYKEGRFHDLLLMAMVFPRPELDS